MTHRQKRRQRIRRLKKDISQYQIAVRFAEQQYRDDLDYRQFWNERASLLEWQIDELSVELVKVRAL